MSESTAAGPSSVRIRPASSVARLRYAGRSRQVRSASVRVSAVSSCIGSGWGATPRRCSLSAQKGWSTRTGTGTAGTPARSPAPVVPAPAWWTTAAVRGEQPVVWQVADEQDVVAGGREFGPAGLDDGAHTGTSDGDRDDVVESFVGRGHAAEPDEHRRGTGREEVDQLIRGLPARRSGRPPVSGHVHCLRPVGGCRRLRRQSDRRPARRGTRRRPIARPRRRGRPCVRVRARPDRREGVDGPVRTRSVRYFCREY